MPFQGNGTFARLYSWVADRNMAVPITASRFDADENDIAAGLSACLTRDGQGSGMTGPLSITLASGTRPLTIKGSSGTSLAIDKVASGNAANILGMTAGVLRWVMALGNATPESSNAGSDFVINRYNDAGAPIDAPLTITRSTGAVALTGPLTGPKGTFTSSVVINNAAGTSREVDGLTNGVARWQLVLGNTTGEGGSNAGSDFNLNRWSDAGTLIDAPLTITRSTGVAAFTHTLQAQAYQCKPGIAGAYRASQFNIDWTGTVPQLWVDNSNLGTFSFVSDYRTKRDVAPLPSMWERCKSLRPIGYRQKDYTPAGAVEPLILGDDKERWGFIAHELQETLIEDAASGTKDGENLLQSPNPWTVIATLTKALQEAMARIEALEKRLA